MKTKNVPVRDYLDIKTEFQKHYPQLSFTKMEHNLEFVTIHESFYRVKNGTKFDIKILPVSAPSGVMFYYADEDGDPNQKIFPSATDDKTVGRKTTVKIGENSMATIYDDGIIKYEGDRELLDGVINEFVKR